MKVIFIRQFDLFFENSLKQFLYYFNLNVLDKNFKNKIELLEFFPIPRVNLFKEDEFIVY